MGFLFSTWASPKMGTLQPWPKVLGFFMGSIYTLKRVSPRIVKDLYKFAFMDGMGTSMLQKSDDWEGEDGMENTYHPSLPGTQ